MLMSCARSAAWPCLQASDTWTAITGPGGSMLKSLHAAAFHQRLDWSHVLGWPPHQPAPTHYAHFLRLKMQHPSKVILLRLSRRAPFNAVGVDAVIVTELLEVKGEQLAGKCAADLRSVQQRWHAPSVWISL
jgi:hypothetical protein